MKNKKVKAMVSGLFVLCLMVSLLTGSAFADANINCVVNQNIDNVEVYSGSTITSCDGYVGILPSGVQLSYSGGSMYLYGTPTQTGSYSVQVNMMTESGAVSVIVNLTVSEAVISPTVTATPAPQQTVAPIDNSVKPSITKHPTGESGDEGFSAVFVARADNAAKFTWRIVSPDTTNTYKATEAAWYFRGLEVSGADTERLVLSNIPKSMNGWAVECMFTNDAGNAFTNGAIIRVNGVTDKVNDPTSTTSKPQNNNGALKNPTLSGNVSKAADTNKLSITASNPNPGLGILNYQWYSADTNSADAMQPITGATSSSYTPPQAESTKYYQVAVWISSTDGKKSETVSSSIVEIAGTPAAGGQTTGSDTVHIDGTPAPSETIPVSPTPSPMPTPEDGGDDYDRGSSSTLIFYIVVAGLALLAVGGILVYLIIANSRGRNRYDDDDE